jgi:phenylacetate-CoA ligase
LVGERTHAADLVSRTGQWRAVLEAADVRSADRVLVALPAELTIGADCWSATREIGATAQRCVPVSVDDIVRWAPTVLISTPGDALRLTQAAADQRINLTDWLLKLVVVTGEPGGSISSARRRIEDRFGGRCLDVYALGDAGVVGTTCSARPDSIHLDERVFDIDCDDAGGGELVLTTRLPRSSPLVGYRTGDLVRLTREPCGCGQSGVRADGGILGRLTERMMVRGVELLPSHVEQVVRRHPAVSDYHLLVYEAGAECKVSVQIEVDFAIASEGDQARVAAEVAEDLKRSLGLRLACEVVTPGSLSEHYDAGRRARRLSRQ